MPASDSTISVAVPALALLRNGCVVRPCDGFAIIRWVELTLVVAFRLVVDVAAILVRGLSVAAILVVAIVKLMIGVAAVTSRRCPGASRRPAASPRRAALRQARNDLANRPSRNRLAPTALVG